MSEFNKHNNWSKNTSCLG